MPITPDTSGNTNTNTSGTTAVVDITSAAVGAWVYALVDVGSSGSNTITPPGGWTAVGSQHNPGSTFGQSGIFRRLKQLGDTTFNFTYPSSFKYVVVWASYNGLDSVTPDDGAGSWLAHDSAASNYDTPAVSNTFAGGWAVALYACRSTVATRTFTSDAALIERQDVGCATSVFFGATLDDSNGSVALGSHTYTATCSGAEAGGAGYLIYLKPAAVPADPMPFAINAPGLYQSPSSVAAPFMGDASIVERVFLTGQPAEVDLAQPVTAILGPAWTVALGQPSDAEIAQPVTVIDGPAHTVTLGQPSEQDDAQPVGSIDGGFAADPTTALYLVAPGMFGAPGSGGPAAWLGDDRITIAVDHTVAVGQPSETDVAQPVAAVDAPLTGTLGQPSETDVAQPMTAIKTQVAILGQPAEVDLAQPVTVVHAALSGTLGQPAETDLAQPIAAAKMAILGQPAEVDLAQPVGSIDGGFAADPTTVLAFAAPGLFGSPGSVATPWVGDAVQAVTGHLLGVGQAQEIELAQSITAVHDQTVAVGQATETDLAQILTVVHPRVIAVGQLIEVDLAQLVQVIHDLHIIAGQAFETDLAQPMTATHAAAVSPVTMASRDGGRSPLSTVTGGAQLSTGTSSTGTSSTQAADMLSTTDEAAGGVTGV